MQRFCPVHGLATGRCGNASSNGQLRRRRLLPRRAADRVQRDHAEVEIEASSGCSNCCSSRPGGKRLRTGDVGGVRIRGDSESALGRSRPRPHPRHDPGHALRLPRQEGPGRRRHRQRDRPRARPARPLHRFPMEECIDVSLRDQPFDPAPYRQELDALWQQFGQRIGVLITEPYLGGGGSYHPPKAYLQMLQSFCREHDIVFILDEVQANFGRTGDCCLRDLRARAGHRGAGQGPGQRRPRRGRRRAGPICSPHSTTAKAPTPGAPIRSAAPPCWPRSTSSRAATCWRTPRESSAIIEAGLVRLKKLPFVAHVRGEKGGMVWGVEMRDHAGHSAADWANAVVLACYRGERRRRHPPARPAGEEGDPHRARRWSSPSRRRRGDAARWGGFCSLDRRAR